MELHATRRRYVLRTAAHFCRLARAIGRFGVLAGRPSRWRLLVVLLAVPAMVLLVGAVSSAQAAAGKATQSSAETRFPFAADLRPYLSTRSGRVSVALFDARTGATYSYNTGARYVTASVVKVAILGTLLRQAQDGRRSLTSTERSLARRMIVQSDNAATTTLWDKVGRASGVRAFMNKVGMPSTTPGTGGFWGLTSTTAPDQVRLVRTVAYPNAVLSDASRAYAGSLMRAVTPSQRWGVSGGVPASGTVALKNGWLPRTGGWVINSIGQVRTGPHNYVIAVLTSGNPDMSYGITTVEHVSAMVIVARQAVSLWAPSSVETGGVFTMSGYGYPARDGRVMVVQRLWRGSWHEVGRAEQSSTGRYSVRTSVASAYKFRYRAVALAWRGARAVVSPPRVVSAHAPHRAPPAGSYLVRTLPHGSGLPWRSGRSTLPRPRS